MNRTQIFVVLALVSTALAAGVALKWYSRPPPDTPYFHWQKGSAGYQLVVSHAAGNPEFRKGVLTAPAPRSGRVRVLGPAGAADPGVLVEVSNPRTRKGYAATADRDGAFSIDAEAQRGDTLKVIARRVRFRTPAAPGYSSTLLSSP